MIHSCPQTPDGVFKTDALNGLWNTFVSYADNKDVTMLCSYVKMKEILRHAEQARQ